MYELARRLPDAEVKVLAPSSAGDADFDRAGGVWVRRLRAAMFGQVPWLAQLTLESLALSLRWRPDAIVCGHVLAGPAALIVRRTLGIPYVVLTHAWEIRRQRRRRLVSRVLHEAALVTANSRFTRASVLRHDIPADRVRILHPGTEPGRFSPTANGAGDAATRPRRLLTVSRLDELYKGHDTVIRALPLIKAKCGEVEYVIAGEGRLMAYLARVARSVGVERHVVFAGRVADAELPALYHSADVLVQMSREARSGGGAEGFSIVCLEAAAAGKPVVAGRSGGLPDAVVDGVTGLLVEPEDDAAVAEAIVSVLQNAVLAQQLGRAGRERVVRELTWDHMAQRARALFAEAATVRR